VNPVNLEDWKRDTECGALRPADCGRQVTVMGWVHHRRDHGGLIFVDLRDRSGVVQVVFNPDGSPACFALAEALRNEYVVAIRGKVAPRPAETLNPNLATGEIEILASDGKLLSIARPIPFQIDGAAVAENVRLKYRYLDLRRPEMQERIVLRHRLTKATRDYLDREGFLEIETPVLTRSTPEGARDYLVPSRVSLGHFYALPQSPQLFKQLLMVSGFDRYFQIVRCFRDEDLRADRQPEFTQIDLEMSFVTPDDVIAITEGILRVAFALRGIEIPKPIPRISYPEAIRRFGIDRPDMRFALELSDVTEVMRRTEFKVFRGAIDAGGIVKALRIPDGERLTRKDLDNLPEVVAPYGAKGVAYRQVPHRGRARGRRASMRRRCRRSHSVRRQRAARGQRFARASAPRDGGTPRHDP
jgi:aspartyl-tRNA synthetase